MRHFEDTWNEAEKEVENIDLLTRFNDINEIISRLSDEILSIDKDQDSINELIGELLFEVSGLSKEFNVNVDAALKLAIDNKKIDRYT